MTERIDLFYCHNSLGSVTAVVAEDPLTPGTWDVVERHAYEAYGKTTILNPDRTVKSSQVPLQPYGFMGRRMNYEEGSGLYYYRNRYYDPEAGRFVSRDPLGMWGDAGQRGNAQNYCGNNPVNQVDPEGLDGQASNPYTLDWKDGGQVSGRGTAKGFSTTKTYDKGMGTKPDLARVEAYFRLAIKRLEHFVTGKPQDSRDKGLTITPAGLGKKLAANPANKGVKGTLTKAQVVAAAKKVLAKIKAKLGKGERIEVHTGEAKKWRFGDKKKAITNNATGVTTIDISEHEGDRQLAQTIMHELFHKWGGVGENYCSTKDAKGTWTEGTKDHAQLIVEQFFNYENTKHIKGKP